MITIIVIVITTNNNKSRVKAVKTAGNAKTHRTDQQPQTTSPPGKSDTSIATQLSRH